MSRLLFVGTCYVLFTAAMVVLAVLWRPVSDWIVDQAGGWAIIAMFGVGVTLCIVGYLRNRRRGLLPSQRARQGQAGSGEDGVGHR